MKKILLIFILIFSFSILGYGEMKIIKENINGSTLSYLNEDLLKYISLDFNSKDKNITLTYNLYINKNWDNNLCKVDFVVMIDTNKRMDIKVKDIIDTLELFHDDPSEFDNDGNPLMFTYAFYKEIGSLLDLIKELKENYIVIYINDKRYIVDNPYKNNKKLKERLIELAIDFCSKENPTLSKKEIEEKLNIPEAKKYL